MSVGAITPAQIWDIVKTSFDRETQKIDEKEADVTALEDKKMAYDHIDNVLEQLQSSLYNFTKTSLFLQRTVSSSDSDVVVASATSKAPETSFTFDSITQLATAARVVSSAGLSLSEGTRPYLESDSDINGGAVNDYDANLPVSNAQGGTQITAGSFTINDVEIEIDLNDTLNTILTKINNSGANVTAVFDDPHDLVRLSGAFIGGDETITFADGTSNFFAAMKLTTEVDGTDNDWEKPLDDTSLNAVIAGYFTINNHTFYVDPATESLDDVIRRVNNSNAGVTMYYDEISDKVNMQNKTEGDSLLLANDSSGFLGTLNLMNQGTDQDAHADYSEYIGDQAQFTLNGEAVTRDTNTFTLQGVTFSLLGTSASSTSVSITKDKEKAITVAQDFVSQFNASLSAINSEFDKEGGPLEKDYTLRTIHNRLLSDVLSQIDNTGQYRSLVDIGFSTDRSGGNFTLTLDEETFRDKLDEDEASLHQLFAYDDDGNGLLDDGGYAVDTRSYLDGYTRSVSGLFYQQNDNIDERIDDIKIDLIKMEDDLSKAEEKKFYDLARQVVQLQEMQQQQAYISQISAIVMSTLM